MLSFFFESVVFASLGETHHVVDNKVSDDEDIKNDAPFKTKTEFLLRSVKQRTGELWYINALQDAWHGHLKIATANCHLAWHS